MPTSEPSSEEFFESLDRSLSSSSSSSSSSAASGRRLPPAALSYDVWLSDPSSISDRRRRLLRQLGLSRDPVLSRGSETDSPAAWQPPERPRTRDETYGRSCTIKSLDDGREFVVEDLGDDGVWNKVSEGGTGRRITVEEFELCVGRSPIVQELMRRQIVAESRTNAGNRSTILGAGPRAAIAGIWRKRGSLLKTIKSMASNRWSGDEREMHLEKGGRRSSSATNDSLDGTLPGPAEIRVRHCGKQFMELSSLYMTQEIDAHNGSIWCIRFSLDGRYLASAGEDRIIHVWAVAERERKGELLIEGAGVDDVNCNPFLAVIGNVSAESTLRLACLEGSQWERRRRLKASSSSSRKHVGLEHVMVPDNVFALSEEPVCSFRGHLDDVLDLSWSKSQYLLSSSMDKTVKLWHMSSLSCLKTFSHSDYVTCIQFNPVDDRYFISGSLDQKVRIWSIPDRQVVDWNDLHEMITAVCYTPDGQGALVGSHRGSCHRYGTSDNKLHQNGQIDLQNKKRKSSSRKITGFQFAPGSSTEVLITSADSRIQVVDGVELVHQFKGFRNTSSQISASLSANGKYVICASEDSHVYVWRYDADSRPRGSKGVVTVTKSYEIFHCEEVTAAVPWPVTSTEGILGTHGNRQNGRINSSKNCSNFSTNSNHFGDGVSVTWPEENLHMTNDNDGPQNNGDPYNGGMQVQSRSAWGMVIVTAGRSGKIRTLQNFGFPIRI